jgi:hypothetical protein
MLNFLKSKFMEWEDYKEKIDFLEVFHWQQNVRNESLRNL